MLDFSISLETPTNAQVKVNAIVKTDREKYQDFLTELEELVKKYQKGA